LIPRRVKKQKTPIDEKDRTLRRIDTRQSTRRVSSATRVSSWRRRSRDLRACRLRRARCALRDRPESLDRTPWRGIAAAAGAARSERDSRTRPSRSSQRPRCNSLDRASARHVSAVLMKSQRTPPADRHCGLPRSFTTSITTSRSTAVEEANGQRIRFGADAKTHR